MMLRTDVNFWVFLMIKKMNDVKKWCYGVMLGTDFPTSWISHLPTQKIRIDYWQRETVTSRGRRLRQRDWRHLKEQAQAFQTPPASSSEESTSLSYGLVLPPFFFYLSTAAALVYWYMALHRLQCTNVYNFNLVASVGEMEI